MSSFAADPKGDIRATWDSAIVAVPWESGTSRLHGGVLDSVPGGAYPLVIHLHGCTGFGGNEYDLAEDLAAAGFIFIAPDSMARDFRPLQCDPDAQTGGQNLFVFDFRMTEASYAVHQLTDRPWVDWSRTYVIGVSEGAVAAALYRGVAFKGRVLLQWTCQGGAIVSGLAETAEPVLSVVYENDPWYSDANTPGQTGDCGDFFRDGRSRSVVLQTDEEHFVLNKSDVRLEIIDFLRELNREQR